MAACEPAQRREGIGNLDAIESWMTPPGRSDRGCSARRGGLWQVVVAVGHRATDCDEYRSRSDRACIYADAADAAGGRDSRSGADQRASRSLDNFGERELALIAGNRRRHREYIVPNYPGHSYRLRLDMPAGGNQPSDSNSAASLISIVR